MHCPSFAVHTGLILLCILHVRPAESARAARRSRRDSTEGSSRNRPVEGSSRNRAAEDSSRNRPAEDSSRDVSAEDNLKYAAEYLNKFGYLEDDVPIKGLTKRKLRELIVNPLKRFQRFHSLDVTGSPLNILLLLYLNYYRI